MQQRHAENLPNTYIGTYKVTEERARIENAVVFIIQYSGNSMTPKIVKRGKRGRISEQIRAEKLINSCIGTYEVTDGQL